MSRMGRRMITETLQQQSASFQWGPRSAVELLAVSWSSALRLSPPSPLLFFAASLACVDSAHTSQVFVSTVSKSVCVPYPRFQEPLQEGQHFSDVHLQNSHSRQAHAGPAFAAAHLSCKLSSAPKRLGNREACAMKRDSQKAVESRQIGINKSHRKQDRYNHSTINSLERRQRLKPSSSWI